MKSFVSIGSCRFLSALALLACSERGGAAEAPPVATGAGPKTHVLFIGADVSVAKDKKLYHVDDVAGDAFIINVDKHPVRIPTDSGVLSLKVDQRVQVTDHKGTISDLKGERAYSLSRDPAKNRALEAVEVSRAMQENADIARSRAFATTSVANSLAGVAPKGDPVATGVVTSAQRTMAMAEAADQLSTSLAASDIATGREHMRLAEAELEKELYDAIEITFTISSSERLNDAYVIVIAHIRDPESKPGSVRNWIYAKSIGLVTDSPRYLRIKHGGFIPGFILEGYDLHIYDHGREIATNVSPKRVDLTKEDASQYALIEYLASHKDATLPPSPAIGSLPADYHDHLGGPNTPRFCYVKVTSDGMPVGVYVDESCSEKLTNEYIEKVLKQIWFKPALVQGKPAEGVAKVKLTSLSM